jgi:Double zinc ribbon
MSQDRRAERRSRKAEAAAQATTAAANAPMAAPPPPKPAFVAKCPHCEMPLTAERAIEKYCYNCRAPLKETITGFVPGRCNGCGGVVAPDATTCKHCGLPLNGVPALEGFREAVNEAVKAAPDAALQQMIKGVMGNPFISEDYKRLIRDGTWLGADGFYFSGLYLTNEQADYIIERILSVTLAGLSTWEFAQVFGVGFSFELDDEARETARYLVRRFFGVH